MAYRYGHIYNANPSAAITGLGTTTSPAVLVARDEKADTLNVQVNVTALNGTAPTLTVSVQWSNDGVNFSDPQTGADAFSSISATGSTVKQFPVKGAWFQLKYVAGGTAVTGITVTGLCHVN